MSKILMMVAAVLLSVATFAQQRTITGKVVNKKTNLPIQGATVQIKTRGTTTDAKGEFSIKASDKDVMTISFVGMSPVKVTVSSATHDLVIALEEGNNELNQVVVVGYTTERKKDLTGAVSVVNVNDIQDIPEGNVMKELQGRVPGMIIYADGSLNGAVTVRLRGQTTLNDNDPLYIIDGIPTQRGLQEINQDDIESIQVLRDASSASIYGARAAAGVIIITTKKGRKGVSKIDFDASTSVQYYNSKLQPLNTQQHAQAYWQAQVNDDEFGPNVNNPINPAEYPNGNSNVITYNWNNNYSKPVLYSVNIMKYIDSPANTMLASNTNWFNEISQPSILQSYNLSMSNGTEHGNTFFSLGFFDNDGIIKESNDTKVTARFNSEFNYFNNRLKIGENLSATYMSDEILPISNITLLSLIENPIIPVHTVTGGWGGPIAGMDDRDNPVREIYDNAQNKNNFGRLFGNVYADLEIIPHLHFKSTFSADQAGNYFRSILLPYQAGFLSSTITQANTSFDAEGTFSWNNILTYDLTLGKNKLNFLAGQESVKDKYQNFNGSGQGLALPDINYAYLSAATSNFQVAGAGSSDALLSYFGKVNYAYNDRYLLSATLRDDGSSQFGPNNRYGLFPAVSGGWRISQEPFFQKKLSVISDLKLRYGWGQTGNQNIPDNATYKLYQSIYGNDLTFSPGVGTAYNISGSGTGPLPSGFTPIQQANPNLKWETTTQSNFGLDFGIFNNKLTGSVDYFIKKTTDILINPPYLAVLGLGGNTWYNGASLQNKGIEVALGYTSKITHDVTLTLAGNIATYRNKVLTLPSDVLTGYPGNGTTETVLGRSVNSLYGYVVEGIFQNAAEVAAAAKQPGDGVGRLRYADLNGDGVIDNNDQEFLGSTDPNFTYGLNTSVSYKNFDLTFFFQGIQGGLEYNNYKYLTDFTSLAPGSNWGTRVLDAWTPENTNTSIPALTLVNANNEGRYSTYFLEPASYLKLRNIQLAYNLKSGLRKLKFVQKAKIYVQANNLLKFKSKENTMPDPENPNSAYPIPVISTIGVNLTF